MLKLYTKAGWQVIRTNGSHVIVSKEKLRETIPMHKELKKGMEQRLMKQLEQGIKK